MLHHSTRWLWIGAAAVAAACASRPAVTTASRTTTTSGGEVALAEPGGMWMDSVGGTWMDTTGAARMGGRRGRSVGLQPADVGMMSNANIVAHLAAGDSLEVALSQIGADRAQNSAVRDFARRMVTEHSAHMEMTRQLAAQGNITPVPSPADTADATMAARVINRLSSAPPGPAYDRQLMRAEVMMHQRMLHELTMLRPRASGAALQLIDQTLPVVRQHLADAQTLWRQMGGGTNAGRNDTGMSP
jgi:putative membrane protein